MKIFLLVLLAACVSFAQDWKAEKIADGLGFTEGTVWLPSEQALVFSDIPSNTLYRWTEKDGLTVFRYPSENANGNTLDPQGPTRLHETRSGAYRPGRSSSGDRSGSRSQEEEQ